ncbi:hypothetical protein MEO41_27920, partial [Dolichospermum sp. ST_sed4]|nr:hypothetical protein [Dolichospermum sp. ST_sed4]
SPLSSSAVFRKSAIDWSTYSEKVGGAYDLFLSSCLVSSGMEVFYVPERLTEYRLHSGSGTSNRRLQNSLETLWVSEKIYTNTYFQDIASDYRNICSYNSKITGNAYLHERQLISALLYYIQAIKYHFIA